MLDREEALSAVNTCMAKLSLSAFFLLAALAPAQDLPNHETLRAAIAIEELEHDADGALARYAAIEADATLPEGVRRHAALRLGRLLIARGDTERGNAALARAAMGEDAVAKAVRESIARSGELSRDAELARRAEDLVARICGEVTTPGAAMPQNAIEDLAWLGDHAVPAIRRRLAREDLRDASKGTLIAALWRECSPAKLELLEAVFSGPHAMTAAKMLPHLRADAKHPELIAAMASRLLPRLSDEVGAALVSSLPVFVFPQPEDLATLLAGDREAMRLAAAQRAHAYWNVRKSPEIAEQLSAALPSLLRRGSRQEVEAARALLGKLAAWSGTARGLWLSEIATAGGGFTVDGELPKLRPAPAPNENLDAFRQALEVPGPSTQSYRLDQAGLRWILEDYLSRDAWDRQALDVVLRAIELGYDVPHSTSWVSKHCTAADVGRVVAALKGREGPLADLAPHLVEKGLTLAALAPLMERLHQKPLDPQDLAAVQLEGLCAALGDGASLARLRDSRFPTVESNSERAVLFSLALARIAFASQHEATVQVLHEALGSRYLSDSKAARGVIVATLIRRGDRRILDQLADLPKSALTERFSLHGLGEHSRTHMTALDALVLTIAREGERAWWHGYPEVDLPAIWSKLLASRDGEASSLREHLRLPLVALEGPSTPSSTALVTAVLDALIRRCAEDPTNWSHNDLARPLALAAEGTAEDARVRQKLEEFMRAALGAQSSWIVQHAIGQLQEHGARYRGGLLVAAGHPDAETASAAFEALEQLPPPTLDECVTLAMTSRGVVGRQRAFARLSELRAGFDALYVAVLDHPEPAVRTAAVNFFATTMDLSVVPHLLERLRDPATEVRDASSAALAAIRLYHEEKQRWEGLRAGVVPLDATSAAAALLAQAGPKNDSAQRVLAITSLGVLGAPEVLPNLIDWLRDADPAVQAAARAAITAIHQKKS